MCVLYEVEVLFELQRAVFALSLSGSESSESRGSESLASWLCWCAPRVRASCIERVGCTVPRRTPRVRGGRCRRSLSVVELISRSTPWGSSLALHTSSPAQRAHPLGSHGTLLSHRPPHRARPVLDRLAVPPPDPLAPQPAHGRTRLLVPRTDRQHGHLDRWRSRQAQRRGRRARAELGGPQDARRRRGRQRHRRLHRWLGRQGRQGSAQRVELYPGASLYSSLWPSRWSPSSSSC